MTYVREPWRFEKGLESVCVGGGGVSVCVCVSACMFLFIYLFIYLFNLNILLFFGGGEELVHRLKLIDMNENRPPIFPI